METDEDLGANLLRQFNCLNTNDRESIMIQLQSLVGVQMNEQTAKFYLDMADWNLQEAVCAYFDLQAANRLPQMSFVQDVTIGEGESVPPNTKFIKTWRIKNTGTDAWPEGCQLIFTGGNRLSAPDRVSVESLRACEETDISVEMISPNEPGFQSSKWRMSTAQGYFFGDAIWVIIQVDSGGTLALMQQLVNMKELGSSSHDTENINGHINPFASTNFHSNMSNSTHMEDSSNPNCHLFNSSNSGNQCNGFSNLNRFS